MLICCVCAYYVFNNFYKLLFPKHITFDLEVVKCDILGEWLKKKKIDEIALYGFSDTLTTRLEKMGIKVSDSVVNLPPSMPHHEMEPNGEQLAPPPNPLLIDNVNGLPSELSNVPDPRVAEYFSKVNSTKLKCIVFQEGLTPRDSIVELKNFLKSGGYVYFRQFDEELTHNESLHEFILEYIKKGQVCVVLNQIPEVDVRKLSLRKRALVENKFIDDSNFIEFEKWHKKLVELKAEFMKQPPPPMQ